MAALCSCCKKMPVVSSFTPEISSRVAERITEEMRARLPENVVEELLATRKRRTRTELGLCRLCQSAGCDGKSPCTIPVDFWLRTGRTSEFENTSMLGDGLRYKQPDSFNTLDTGLQLGIVGSWHQASNNQWIKVIEAPIGELVCELLMAADSRGYIARVTVRQKGLGSPDEVLESFDPLPLQEAQVICDNLALLVINNEGPLIWSVDSPLSS